MDLQGLLTRVSWSSSTHQRLHTGSGLGQKPITRKIWLVGTDGLQATLSSPKSVAGPFPHSEAFCGMRRAGPRPGGSTKIAYPLVIVVKKEVQSKSTMSVGRVGISKQIQAGKGKHTRTVES